MNWFVKKLLWIEFNEENWESCLFSLSLSTLIIDLFDYIKFVLSIYRDWLLQHLIERKWDYYSYRSSEHELMWGLRNEETIFIKLLVPYCFYKFNSILIRIDSNCAIGLRKITLVNFSISSLSRPLIHLRKTNLIRILPSFNIIIV